MKSDGPSPAGGVGRGQASVNLADDSLRSPREAPASRVLPCPVKVADDQAPSVVRLGELQQQGQALLADDQSPGGQQGRQQPAHVGVLE